MKHILVILGMMIMVSACQSKDSIETDSIPEGFHKVIVKKVIHTNKYTYLLVTEDKTENWLAIPRMDAAEEGTTYYYEGGFDMVDFKSKELDRTFEKVVFLGGVSTEPVSVKKKMPQANPHGGPQGNPHENTQQADAQPNGKVLAEKATVELSVVEGGITIAELFANREDYNGKIVKIKGEVVKYSEAIMNTNWIHLQDGTEHEGSFDLTVTSNQSIEVGSVVTVEGMIILNKDFGYGYFYDVLMQNAKIIK